jgi:hypothetical protein
MAMTRKHFEMIAAVVREHGGDQRAELAEAFARELRAENGRFDTDRFRRECGVETAN